MAEAQRVTLDVRWVRIPHHSKLALQYFYNNTWHSSGVKAHQPRATFPIVDLDKVRHAVYLESNRTLLVTALNLISTGAIS